MNRANIQGTTEQQAEQLRSVMAVIFPEAVTLVREAREGLQYSALLVQELEHQAAEGRRRLKRRQMARAGMSSNRACGCASS